MKKENLLSAVSSVVTVLILFTSTTFAQSDSIKSYRTDEVLVTATRTKKNQIDVGRSVVVLSSKKIKQGNYNSLGDLLSRTAGVSIIGANQTFGSIQSLYLRGANSNQTLVMLDGMRITDPSSPDNSVDLSEFSLSDIDQIEIVKGSHSTLYGSSAIGGVVNIISNKLKKTGFNLDAKVDAGSYGSGSNVYKENIFMNYTKNGFYTNINFFNEYFTGLDATLNNFPDNVYTSTDKDSFNKTDITGKIGFSNNQLDLYFTFNNANQKLDLDDGAFADDDNNKLSFNRKNYTLGANYKITDLMSLKFISNYNGMIRKSVDDSSVIDFDGTYDQSYSEGEYKGSSQSHDIVFNLNQKAADFVGGLSYYKEEMTTRNFFSTKRWGGYTSESNLDSLNLNTETYNAFLQFDFKGEAINKSYNRLNLSIGGRYIHHSSFGSEFVYQINPSYKLFENSLLYFNYSTGYNAPALYRLYSPGLNYNSGITRGNKNLSPEKSKTIELGFKQQLKNLFFSISLFQTITKNNIEYVYLWDADQPIDSLSYLNSMGDTYLNLGTQTLQGIEFNVNFSPFNNLNISGNFTIIDGRLEISPNDINSSQTKNSNVQLFNSGAFINRSVRNNDNVRKSNTANLTIDYTFSENVNIYTQIKYVGNRNDAYYNGLLGPNGALDTKTISNFTLFDIGANYNFINNLSFNIKIENLFNRKYSEILGYRTRGRGMFLGVRLTY